MLLQAALLLSFCSVAASAEAVAVGCASTWTTWGNWSPCPTEYSEAVYKIRYRECYVPQGCTTIISPGCAGQNVEQIACPPSIPGPIPAKPVENVCISLWTEWQPWSECPPPSQGPAASKHRERYCLPFPTGCTSKGPLICTGNNVEFSPCVIPTTTAVPTTTTTTAPPVPCQHEGAWGEWLAWSTCPTDPEKVKHFIQMRERKCTLQPKGCAGSFTPYCAGDNIEQRQCITAGCNPVGEWGAWGGWSDCPEEPESEEENVQIRKRACENRPKYCVPNPMIAPQCPGGSASELKACPAPTPEKSARR
ncbi:hypothetical protein QR680_004701 [Steinernema hermaphroditum]|uniref:Uncharacterized protein n=1 Tax=Steinernema hermaphroditum TaxID=289476 RepID=A0AA39HPJ5_9BILA|nr:hypothetical protein QR680_004701 [Steinernema hermaphroditum]